PVGRIVMCSDSRRPGTDAVAAVDGETGETAACLAATKARSVGAAKNVAAASRANEATARVSFIKYGRTKARRGIEAASSRCGLSPCRRCAKMRAVQAAHLPRCEAARAVLLKAPRPLAGGRGALLI